MSAARVDVVYTYPPSGRRRRYSQPLAERAELELERARGYVRRQFADEPWLAQALESVRVEPVEDAR